MHKQYDIKLINMKNKNKIYIFKNISVPKSVHPGLFCKNILKTLYNDEYDYRLSVTSINKK